MVKFIGHSVFQTCLTPRSSVVGKAILEAKIFTCFSKAEQPPFPMIQFCPCLWGSFWVSIFFNSYLQFPSSLLAFHLPKFLPLLAFLVMVLLLSLFVCGLYWGWRAVMRQCLSQRGLPQVSLDVITSQYSHTPQGRGSGWGRPLGNSSRTGTFRGLPRGARRATVPPVESSVSFQAQAPQEDISATYPATPRLPQDVRYPTSKAVPAPPLAFSLLRR